MSHAILELYLFIYLFIYFLSSNGLYRERGVTHGETGGGWG